MIKKLKNDLLKNKTNLFILTAIFFVLFCYCFSYLHYRKNRYLIHRKSWTNDRNIHRIARGDINEKHLIMMLNGKKTDEIMEVGIKVERKINFIYYFYYPCSLCEEMVWYIIDG